MRVTLQSIGALSWCAALAVCALVVAKSAAQSGKAGQSQTGAIASSSNASPIVGVTNPPGYRDWKRIAVGQLLAARKVDQLRAQLGNDIAISAFREGESPFPDGGIIAVIHWTRVPSQDNNRGLDGPFPVAQSFVAGCPVNVRLMVKDSKRYAASGPWGFADVTDGAAGNEALHETYFGCHQPAKDHDFLFAQYAPAPRTSRKWARHLDSL